ncbi:15564_t:CDS:2, partial [Gigaspora rosea]
PLISAKIVSLNTLLRSSISTELSSQKLILYLHLKRRMSKFGPCFLTVKPEAASNQTWFLLVLVNVCVHPQQLLTIQKALNRKKTQDPKV